MGMPRAARIGTATPPRGAAWVTSEGVRIRERAAVLGLRERRLLHDAHDAVIDAGIQWGLHADVCDVTVRADLHRDLDGAMGRRLLATRGHPGLHLAHAIGDHRAVEALGHIAPSLWRWCRAAARRLAATLLELRAARTLVVIEDARDFITASPA